MIQSARARRRVELVRRTRHAGLVLRCLALVATLAALACIHLAAAQPVFGGDTLTIDGLAVIAAAICLVYPDGHAGILVLALLTAKWLIDVDEPAGWWTFALAATFAIFHATVAAAAIAPPSARWTRAMTRRWTLRTAVLVGSCAATALMVASIARLDLRGDVLVFSTALIALTAGALWIGADHRQAADR